METNQCTTVHCRAHGLHGINNTLGCKYTCERLGNSIYFLFHIYIYIYVCDCVCN